MIDTLRDVEFDGSFMLLSVQDEFRCPKSGYSIEIRVNDLRVNAKSNTGGCGRVVSGVRRAFSFSKKSDKRKEYVSM